MPEIDKITLGIAKLIREDLLQQNLFTAYDRYCPLYKTIWMMRNFVTFYRLAQAALEIENKDVTWESMKNAMGDVLYKLMCMKFQEPSAGREQLVAHMKALNSEIKTVFMEFNCS